MGQVSLSIHARNYVVSCDDGQEQHLTRLGEYLNDKVQKLSRSAGGVGDSRLLVMAALLICDELFEARDKLSGSTPKNGSGEESSSVSGARDMNLEDFEAAEASMAEALNAVAERIEALAVSLEGA